MKITNIETLHCDAGWRVNSFLKVSTDDGITGWSEFMEGYGAQGLGTVIEKLAARLVGQDPRPVEKHSNFLYAATRQAAGGLNAQAIGAIENALVDIKAKALGVPVYDLLGGPYRDRMQVYWSHCGTYRARYADRIKEWAGVEPVRTLDDVVALGREVREKGFKGLKTNLIRFEKDRHYMYGPGTGNQPGFPELNADSDIAAAAVDQLSAFREGAGKGSASTSTPTSTTKSTAISGWRGRWSRLTSSGSRLTSMTRRGWRVSAIRRARRSPRSNRSTAGATSARSSNSSPSITRSSTWPGTASSNR